ncbi:hypothetical protein PSEUDO8Z_100460 [Pseudomonas sp. 8Z]|nr:hypothetical protein PSEUDO8Z_100460 [Pseudomonas sp. 8Z]
MGLRHLHARAAGGDAQIDDASARLACVAECGQTLTEKTRDFPDWPLLRLEPATNAMVNIPFLSYRNHAR